jgi:ribosomal protein S18 acetylase RimI-like enzyme
MVELFLRVACDWQDELLTVATCWLDGDTLAGYMTTSMNLLSVKDLSAIQKTEMGAPLAKFAPESPEVLKAFPALKIGMLGVCEKYKGNKLGPYMVSVAIGQADALSERIGCRFVMVDSANTERAVKMYERLNFKPFPGQKKRATISMYYDVLTNRTSA